MFINHSIVMRDFSVEQLLSVITLFYKYESFIATFLPEIKIISVYLPQKRDFPIVQFSPIITLFQRYEIFIVTFLPEIKITCADLPHRGGIFCSKVIFFFHIVPKV